MRKALIFFMGVIPITLQAQSFQATVGKVITSKDLVKIFNVKLFDNKGLDDAIPYGFLIDRVSRRAFGNFPGIAQGKYLCYEDYLNPTTLKTYSSDIVDDKNVEIISIVTHNDRQYLFFKRMDKARDQFAVFVSEINKDLESVGSPVLVRRYENLSKSGSYLGVRVSPNNKFFLLSRGYDGKAADLTEFEYTILDSGFGQVVTQYFKSDFRNDDGFVNTVSIDDNGNFYVLTTLYMQRDVKLAILPNRTEIHPRLIFYNTSEKKLMRIDIGPNDGSTFGMIAGVKNSEYVVIGLNKVDKAIRCFLVTFDVSTGVIKSNIVVPMSQEFQDSYTDGVYQASSWEVSDYVMLDNKGTVAKVEARVNVVDQNGRFKHAMSYNTFLVSFTPDGKVNFNTVYKRQQGTKDVIGSKLMAHGNKFFLLYNDSPDNITVDPGNKKFEPFNGKKARIMVQEFDETRKVMKYPLLSGEGREDYITDIRGMMFIGDGKYFLSAYSHPKLPIINNINVVIDLSTQ